jgi:hypothetical protein
VQRRSARLTGQPSQRVRGRHLAFQRIGFASSESPTCMHGSFHVFVLVLHSIVGLARTVVKRPSMSPSIEFKSKNAVHVSCSTELLCSSLPPHLSRCPCPKSGHFCVLLTPSIRSSYSVVVIIQLGLSFDRLTEIGSFLPT